MLRIKFGLALALTFLVALLFYHAGAARPDSRQTTTFIDVGQGDAALISDGQGFNVLIDGSKPSEGPALVEYLRTQGISDIQVMVASHADSDHIGGLIDVLKSSEIHVHQVAYNGYAGSTATWDNFAAAVTADGLVLTPLQFPAELTWGQMKVYVLNPAAGLTNPNTNKASVVLRIDYGSVKYLFTGDIDAAIEATVVARQTPVASQILKVAHHGSNGSSSAPFLAAVQPKEGVISVGVNSYGHPGAETLLRLNDAGARIWRTDQDGNIIVTSNGSTYAVNGPLPVFMVFLPAISQTLP